MTQQRSIETRSRIIETSKALFSSQGYENTSVSEICATAGISKGAFYHHFISKHQVFTAILDSWLQDLNQDLQSLFRLSPSVPEGILAMTGEFDRIMHDSSSSLSLFLEFWRYSSRDPEIWKKTNEPYFQYIAFIKNILDQGVREGSIQVKDAKSATYTVMSLAIGLILQNMMNPDMQDWPKISENAFQLLLTGITRSK